MHLFNVTEPKNQKRRGPLEPGLEFAMEEGAPVVHLVTTEEYGLMLPMDHVLAQHAEQAIKLAQATGTPRIYRADLTRQGEELCLVSEKDPGSREAVVLISTAPGEDGELRLTANTFREGVELERWGRHTHLQVTKMWNTFPPPGVEIVNCEHIEVDENGVCRWGAAWAERGVQQAPPPILLKMVAGASFRVWRSGDLGGAAPVFLVSWSGKELWTVVPRNYEKKSG